MEVLRAHRRRQAELFLLLGTAWVDAGLVFIEADGAALVPDSAWQRFDRLVIRAGLTPVRLHGLRHLPPEPVTELPSGAGPTEPARSTGTAVAYDGR